MKQLIYIFLFACLLTSACDSQAVSEHNYAFIKSKKEYKYVSENTKYGESFLYGYDFNTTPQNGGPFFFLVHLPEGNSRVKVVLGNKENESCTNVKSGHVA